MSEYKRALRRTWTGWRATNEELELIRKCTVIEEARVGHEIRLNDMMRTLAMKRVREILLIHDLKERQKDKNYVDNQLKFTKLVLQSFENEDENGKTSDD